MANNREIDAHSGVETTGHEWDGLKELNKPLPRWWLYVFYATIIWSIGYWIAYPAFPLLSSYTKGLLGYSSRERVDESLAKAKDVQSRYNEAIAKASLAEIREDPKLLAFAIAGGRAVFANNCAGCHGRGAQGAPGYPNLNDDNWIWGGTLDAIQQTIAYGVRSGSEQARISQMPRFGLDGLLKPEQIDDVAEYVRSLSKLPHDVAAAERGKAVFNGDGACASCHGEDGKGNQAVGASNLTANIWLYGGSKDVIVKTIREGRGGVMPAWAGRLDPETIKKLAVYVHSLGGGQ
ncbi:MAG TPA: cytochrome-c oxidase, cbb3-type subunit III [Hyphomicrobiales bacterium]|nr:cytochrome-c oxidase, cbb3-type subunit III [Hyphomicrobiales bacterium]